MPRRPAEPASAARHALRPRMRPASARADESADLAGGGRGAAALADIAYTLTLRRRHEPVRAAFVVADLTALQAALTNPPPLPPRGAPLPPAPAARRGLPAWREPAGSPGRGLCRRRHAGLDRPGRRRRRPGGAAARLSLRAGPALVLPPPVRTSASGERKDRGSAGLFAPAWIAAPASPAAMPAGLTLALLDPAAEAGRLVDLLPGRVVVVRPGADMTLGENRPRTVRPDADADYAALLEAYGQPDRVLHLWPLGAETTPRRRWCRGRAVCSCWCRRLRPGSRDTPSGWSRPGRLQTGAPLSTPQPAGWSRAPRRPIRRSGCRSSASIGRRWPRRCLLSWASWRRRRPRRASPAARARCARDGPSGAGGGAGTGVRHHPSHRRPRRDRPPAARDSPPPACGWRSSGGHRSMPAARRRCRRWRRRGRWRSTGRRISPTRRPWTSPWRRFAGASADHPCPPSRRCHGHVPCPDEAALRVRRRAARRW